VIIVIRAFSGQGFFHCAVCCNNDDEEIRKDLSQKGIYFHAGTRFIKYDDIKNSPQKTLEKVLPDGAFMAWQTKNTPDHHLESHYFFSAKKCRFSLMMNCEPKPSR
jgi:hypothetical protein